MTVEETPIAEEEVRESPSEDSVSVSPLVSFTPTIYQDSGGFGDTPFEEPRVENPMGVHEARQASEPVALGTVKMPPKTGQYSALKLRIRAAKEARAEREAQKAQKALMKAQALASQVKGASLAKEALTENDGKNGSLTHSWETPCPSKNLRLLNRGRRR